MLELLRRSVGLQVARFHFRKSREKVISFTKSISEAQQALLIMPLDLRELLPSIMVIDLLKKRFREENITIVTGEHNVEVMRVLPRSQVIRVLVPEVTVFYLPRREVIDRVNKRRYDVAIDLNLDLILPSAYICKESNARVRIGFASRRADTFYNFQIQPDPTLSKQHLYDRLAKFLQMF